MHEHADAPDASATTLHDGGPAADKQIDGSVLYAVGENGAPLHDKGSLTRMHAQAVKEGRTHDAATIHAHLERRHGGGDGHRHDEAY